MVFNVEAAFFFFPEDSTSFFFFPLKPTHFTPFNVLDANVAQTFLEQVPQSTYSVTDEMRCANIVLTEAVVSLHTLQTFLCQSSMF